MDVRLPHSPPEDAPSAIGDLLLRWRRDGRRRWILFGILGLALAALPLWQFFTASPPAAAPQAPPVIVGRAQLANVTAVDRTVGTVVTVATVQVAAQVSGQLMAANFREGQIVHAGDMLFQIDPRPFADALKQAQAALARDQANTLSAEHDKARFVALFTQGAASAQQRDQAVATAAADEAIVKLDSAAVSAAQLNLGYTVIRSPITGKTGPLLVQPGNLVVANNATSPLVTITQIQPIMVSVSLAQSDLPQLGKQMQSHKLFAIVDLHDGALLKAPIDFIGNQVDARTGTIELRATFPNSDSRLVPGQLVDVGVTMHEYPHAIVVPHEAVNLGPASRYVFVVGRDGLAQMRNVTVLYDDGARTAITGDVRAGDTVITQGQLRVVPGQKVSISRGTAA